MLFELSLFLLCIHFFFFSSFSVHIDLHSFPTRRSSDLRLFSRRHVDQIRFIKRAQELGFTLSEIDDLLNLKMDEDTTRSEEHTSELQSRGHLVCRLLLEKKKRKIEKYKPKEKKIKV